MKSESNEQRGYFIGTGLSFLLTVVAFGSIYLGLTRLTALLVIGGAALVQVIVQLRYFLHIDLSAQKREDVQLIMFSTLILAIMLAGTTWVLSDLSKRMM